MPNLTWLRLREAAKVLKIYRAAYRNWPSVLLSLAIRGRAKAVTRDDRVVEGDDVLLGAIARHLVAQNHLRCCEIVGASGSVVTIRVGDRKALLYGWRAVTILDLDEYTVLDVRGRSVLDIGAFVGDSAILFALMGARRVVAVEPSPWAYSMAKKNVEVNGLNGVITLVNCAVGREDGRTLMLPLTETTTSFRIAVTAANAEGDVPVPTCALDSLIEKYGPFDVVKMDCEGCEHDSIPYSRRIGGVEEILIEYHGGYEDIVRKLREEGFKSIKYLLPGEGEGLHEKPIDAKLGYIYASKNSV